MFDSASRVLEDKVVLFRQGVPDGASKRLSPRWLTFLSNPHACSISL
jgi:hypothetical protein